MQKLPTNMNYYILSQNLSFPFRYRNMPQIGNFSRGSNTASWKKLSQYVFASIDTMNLTAAAEEAKRNTLAYLPFRKLS